MDLERVIAQGALGSDKGVHWGITFHGFVVDHDVTAVSELPVDIHAIGKGTGSTIEELDAGLVDFCDGVSGVSAIHEMVPKRKADDYGIGWCPGKIRNALLSEIRKEQIKPGDIGNVTPRG